MNRFVSGAVALIAAGWTVSAQAADLYGSRAPYTVNQPLNAYSWAGPYLGGNLGYAWGSVDNNPTKPSGFAGGVQAGYNWQSPGTRGCSASRATSRPPAPKIPLRRGNSPTPGSARCAAASAMRSTTCCSSAPAVWPSANCAPRLSACRNRIPMRAGPGRRRRNRLRPELERQDRISLRRSVQQQFIITGASNGYRFGMMRAGVNYHF